MSKVDYTVSVEKSGKDLCEKLALILKAVKASGGFTAAAIPAEIGAAVAELPAIVADITAIPADAHEDLLGFVKGVNLGVYDLLDAVLK